MIYHGVDAETFHPVSAANPVVFDGKTLWLNLRRACVSPSFARRNQGELARRVETLYFFVCKNFFCRNLGLAREGDG